MSYLFELFSKRAAMRLLEFFMGNPSQEFYRAELLKKVKVAKASATKWLGRLVADELLLKTVRGRTVLYKLNSDYLIVKELKKMKTISTILPEVGKLAGNGVEMFIYGSCARGEETEGSDVDLLVIGERTDELISAISALEKKIGRRANAGFYSRLEWSMVARKDPAFYERVEKDKIRLV
jgi:predicted nucleotidyltransferase